MNILFQNLYLQIQLLFSPFCLNIMQFKRFESMVREGKLYLGKGSGSELSLKIDY
jgi:hypothetical protein